MLALLVHARPRRILEIGTALGHMTANLAEWSPDEAVVFSLGTVAGEPATGSPQQAPEAPPRADFGRLAGHFGKGHKVFLTTADSLHYDFSRLAPLDFAFIDGAHDLQHVLSDSRKVYEALAPGGCLVWHDFNSPIAWVQVRQALEQAGLKERGWEKPTPSLPTPRPRFGGEGSRNTPSPPLPLPRGERGEE